MNIHRKERRSKPETGTPNIKRLRLRRGGIDKVVQGDGKENQKRGVLQAKWRKGSRGDIEQQCQILAIGLCRMEDIGDFD